MKEQFKQEGFHTNITYDFVSIEPLKIDFRTAQAAGENGIVQFLTPDIYIVYQDIKNPKGMFNVATFLMGAEKKGRFKQEYAVRYSKERIQESFRDLNTFAFFSESEAAELTKLFEAENFTSAKVGVFSTRSGGDILKFGEDEFELVAEYMRTHDILRVVPSNVKSEFTDEFVRQEGFKAGYAKAKSEIPYFNGRDNYTTKKKLQRTGLLATGLFALCGTSQVIGKKLIGKGVPHTILGMSMYAVGAIGNMLAFKIGNTVISKFNEDVIIG